MNDLLLDVLEAFPNFVVVDTAGVIVFMNQSYADLLGISKEDAIGRPVADVIPGTRLNIVLKTGEAEMGSIISMYDHVSKKVITVVCNRIPIRKNGKVIGVLAETTISNLHEVNRLHNEVEQIRKENQKYKAELAALKSTLHPLEKVIGKSPAMESLKQTIADYAASNLSVLLTGETGVGKEVFARTIHQLSGRAHNNYVKINCAAIPANLLESELFGYADGAFSGAAKGGKIGKFEQANGGTLLLDEIGEMPLGLQAKLLRVLQEKEVERVGGIKPIKIDVRIICSTNEDLEQLIRDHRFREDLYYRINVVELRIPPLRERRQDIPALCDYFIDKINRENGYALTCVDPYALEILTAYHWPGNIRELEHVIERAAVRAKTGAITAAQIQFLNNRAQRQESKDSWSSPSLRDRTAQTERDSILQALAEVNGNKTKAAQLLGIDRSRLYHKMRKYQLL